MGDLVKEEDSANETSCVKVELDTVDPLAHPILKIEIKEEYCEELLETEEDDYYEDDIKRNQLDHRSKLPEEGTAITGMLYDSDTEEEYSTGKIHEKNDKRFVLEEDEEEDPLNYLQVELDHSDKAIKVGDFYKCIYCEKRFSRKGNLNLHTRTHTGVRPYKCDKCDKRFSYKSNLNTHVKHHTGDKPFPCAKCDKSFLFQSQLAIHESVHSGERPFKCELCDKTFSRYSCLISHGMTHNKVLSYGCPVCGKHFARKYDSVIHTRIHTGEKLYFCEVCNKKFTHSSSLWKHKKIHTGETNFTCNICNKGFSVKSGLAKHMRTHMRIKK